MSKFVIPIFLIISVTCLAQKSSFEIRFLEALYFDSSKNFKKDYTIEEFKNLYNLKIQVESQYLFERELTIITLHQDLSSVTLNHREGFPWHTFVNEITLVIDKKSDRAFRIYGFNGNDLIELVYFIKKESWERDIKFNKKVLIKNLSTSKRDLNCVYVSLRKNKLNNACLLSYSDPIISARSYN